MDCLRRSATAAAVGLALLVAMVVCPVMAAAASGPVSSSCHERPDPDDPDGAIDALTCCTTVTLSASLQPPDDTATVAPAGFTTGPDRLRSAADRYRLHRPPTIAPPLFVQHASLLI